MSKDQIFHTFCSPIDLNDLPQSFPNPFGNTLQRCSSLATKELQETIQSRSWDHNFGLGTNTELKAIGKMFGVLVVRNPDAEIGYLAAFSGKIGEQNHYPGFVPPIFDTLEPGGFLNQGMKALNVLNLEIAELEDRPNQSSRIEALKKARTDHSNSLQDRIYESYQLLNVLGEERGIKEIFREEGLGNPPGGAGDCAAPKLLQYAFVHEMQPISLAEFWWGRSEDSPQWRHKQVYPPCTHKCVPILKHMLKGLPS